MPGIIICDSEQQLADVLADARRLQRVVVVKFGATWCPPCQRLKPALEALAADASFSDCLFLDVDVDALPDVAATNDIRTVPVVLVCGSDGAILARLSGPSGVDVRNTLTRVQRDYFTSRYP